jgi:hypothetical protein
MEYHPTFVFISKLVNKTKYTYWDPTKETYAYDYPFYCKNIPDISTIIKYGCNCAGLLNIIQLMKGQKVPGILTNNYYSGGTYLWFEYLNNGNYLEKIDINKLYPAGSLLIRRYRDVSDQGHVAIIYSSGSLLEQQLLHCYPDKGIVIDKNINESHSWIKEGYYEYICVDWFNRVIQDPPF